MQICGTDPFRVLHVIFAALICFLAAGCGSGNKDSVATVIPAFYQPTNTAEILKYSAEFLNATNETIVLPRALSKLLTNAPQTKIDVVDHNPACSLWAVSLHNGERYFDNQKIYVYSELTDNLNEVSAFSNLQVEGGFVFSNALNGGSFLIASAQQHDSKWWQSDLWSYNFRTYAKECICSGGYCEPSPDHSKLAFWRTDGAGFHNLNMMDIASGKIDDVISLWEQDPGSGISWNVAWSKDSKVLRVVGSCRGFDHHWKSSTRNIDLFYFVNEGKIVDMAAQNKTK